MLFGRPKILKEAAKGDIDVIRELIANGANVNEKDKYGSNALATAVSQGHIDIVKLLLTNEVDVNAKNIYGMTALMAASQCVPDRIDILKELCLYGADVNVIDSFGLSALVYWMADGKNISAFKFLIDNGGNVNLKNDDEHTILMYAVIYGRKDIVECLLDKGADINAEGARRITPLCCAAGYWYEMQSNGIFDELEKGEPERTISRIKAYEDILILLLSKGADVKGNNGRRALWWALNYGQYNNVKALLSKNIDINAKYKGGTCIYDVLCDYNDGMGFYVSKNDPRVKTEIVEIIKLLLAKGADVNIKNDNGMTPLKIAKLSYPYNTFPELVQILAAAGAEE